jgi:hypothetical protein
MTAARPTLTERLQAQLVKYERELAFLRPADEAMKERLRRALVEGDELRKERIDLLARLTAAERRATEAQATAERLTREGAAESAKLRAELAALKAAVSAETREAVADEKPATRFALLEVE